MGKIGEQFLQGIRNFFGKPLGDFDPINLDIPVFNSSTQEWELQQAIIGSAVQTSSNVGTGEGVALARVGDDLPFRSLVPSLEVLLTGSPTEIAFTIGMIAISKVTGLQTELNLKLESPIDISDVTNLQTELDSKLESPILISDVTNLQTELDSKDPPFLISDITGLQTALDDLEPPFLISDITGLQTALDSKIESITNVGAENELIKAKVGTNVDVRTLKAGTNITITQTVDNLTIDSTDIGQDNTMSNVGTGVDVFLQKIGVNFELRTLLANAEILITQNALDLAFSIGAIAQSKITGLVSALATKIETVVNVGTGVGKIFRDKVGTTINFKSLTAGTNVTIVNNADDIVISSTDTGEANTGSNVGTGVDVFLQKVLVDLEFRTLLANTEILITQNALDLAFSIGEIPQSKITTLVFDLANRFKTFQNIGTGKAIGKLDTGTEFDLRTLLENTEILIAQNAQDLSFSIGAIAIAKITGLQTALDSKLESPILISDVTGLQAELDSKDPPFLISDITGLQLALDGKIETITNVGGEKELIKAKVGTNVDVRTLKAGTNVTLVQNANDVEISSTQGANTQNTFDRIVKKVDEIVNNSSVLQDDDELFSTLAINKTYFFQLLIFYESNVTPEFKYAFTVPAGATVRIIDDDRWDSGGDRASKDGTVATEIGSDGTIQTMALFGRVIMGATAGDLTFQFAQVVANASDTETKQGSALIVWEEK